MIFAWTLFWVTTRGCRRTRTLPSFSSALSSAVRLNEPLMLPSARLATVDAASTAWLTLAPPLTLFGERHAGRVAELRRCLPVEAPRHAKRPRELLGSRHDAGLDLDLPLRLVERHKQRLGLCQIRRQVVDDDGVRPFVDGRCSRFDSAFPFSSGSMSGPGRS